MQRGTKILYVPDFDGGDVDKGLYVARSNDRTYITGYGHLIRAIRLMRQLPGEVLIPLQHISTVRKIAHAKLEKSTKKNVKFNLRLISEINARSYDMIIVDKREARISEMQNYHLFGPTLGIDLGGEGRSYASYLIDTLPNFLEEGPNLSQYGALPFEPSFKKKKQWSFECTNIVYYTHENGTRKEISFLEKLLQIKRLTLCILTNYQKAYSSLLEKFSNLKLKSFDITFFNDQVHEYDLCITHFGLTMYESLKACIPVVLMNTSAYHRDLSVVAQVPKHFWELDSSSTTTSGYHKLYEYIYDLVNNELCYAELISLVKNILGYDFVNASSTYLNDLILGVINKFQSTHIKLPKNPWTGDVPERAVYRDTQKTIYKCQHTKQYYQLPFAENLPSYSSDRFNENNKEQYGLTYFEEYQQILLDMQRRMKTIKDIFSITMTSTITYNSRIYFKKKKSNYIPERNLVLVDLGCGYGASLVAAEQYGFEPVGIDVNKEVIKYIHKSTPYLVLEVDIESADFSQLLKKAKIQLPVAIFTAFFMLEHIKNIQHLLSNIHDMLMFKGMFVCSVPNAHGISFRKKRNLYFERSPIDQYNIFTPKGMKTLLTKSGFKVVKLLVTEHHPEHFGVPHFFKPLMIVFSKLFKLGDSFEIYALKLW